MQILHRFDDTCGRRDLRAVPAVPAFGVPARVFFEPRYQRFAVRNLKTFTTNIEPLRDGLACAAQVHRVGEGRERMGGDASIDLGGVRRIVHAETRSIEGHTRRHSPALAVGLGLGTEQRRDALAVAHEVEHRLTLTR